MALNITYGSYGFGESKSACNVSYIQFFRGLTNGLGHTLVCATHFILIEGIGSLEVKY